MKILFSNLPPLFLAISYLFFSTNFAGAVDSYFKTCQVPKYCGNQTISFPFYIQGAQEQFCGHPGFQISCVNNKSQPILNLSGEDYIIQKIFYENKSIIVSNAAISQDRSCFPIVKNLSLPTDRFTLVSNNTQVLLFYGCPISSPFAFGPYDGCYDGNTNFTVSVSLSAIPDGDECRNFFRWGMNAVVAAPVMNRPSTREGNSVKEVMRRGFLLNWIARDCLFCQRSGGKCGFNHTSYHFRCYCPDRPHAELCLPAGKSITLAVRLGIATASTLAVIGILIITLMCLRKKSSVVFFWRNNQNKTHRTVETFLRSYGPLQVKRYCYQDIKKMTKCFREKLGKGGFGDVYKGKLDNGCLVAVKVLNHSKSDNGQEFINEVATISGTSHVNVVTLLGFCFEGSKRALIYEFMPNGSLEKFVFDENINHDVENSNKLDWEKHYQISIGIARGLEYLHRGCNTRIVHFDIKPHNILLDTDFVPKISDFGLAKICAKNISAVSMEVPRGTIGYIAPEIVSRNIGEVSNKSDVYSYGMLILEMVGGRRNANVRAVNSSELYFPHLIYKQLEMDEDLGLKKISDEEERLKVRKMVIVSLWCIQTDPSKRPTMGKVIEMLEGNLDSLQIPPKPFLSSPSRSPRESSGTF